MFQQAIDFNKISKALTESIETIQQDQTIPENVKQQIESAREQFQQALSFNLQHTHLW